MINNINTKSDMELKATAFDIMNAIEQYKKVLQTLYEELKRREVIRGTSGTSGTV